jgi:hypothetical protein
MDEKTKQQWEAIANAENRAEALEEHFMPWAVTDECKELLHELMQNVTKVEVGKKSLTLVFLNEDEEDEHSFEFGEPYKGNYSAECIESWKQAGALHSYVQYESYGGGDFYWHAKEGTVDFNFGYDEYDFVPDKEGKFSSNEERFPVLSYAGQNFFMMDKAQKNKLGEPMIVLFDHGCDFEDCEGLVFGENMQREIPFGIPGFILRVIANHVLDWKRFDDCGMG